MDYFEKKMAQRLVIGAPQADPRAEEQLFYDSFGEGSRRFARIMEILAFWTDPPENEREQNVRIMPDKVMG